MHQPQLMASKGRRDGWVVNMATLANISDKYKETGARIVFVLTL